MLELDVVWSKDHGNHDDTQYLEYLSKVQSFFLSCLGTSGKEPLFLTDAEDLWEIYLDNFDSPEERQHHNCSTCKQFIRSFGSLAVVNEGGRVVSCLWNEDDAPENLRRSVAALSRAVRRSKIVSPFLSKDKLWGTPETGVWNHLHIVPPKNILLTEWIATPFQRMAEKKEDFKNVMRALSDFSPETLETALTLLRSDSLYRSEKVLGQAEWLANLHKLRSSGKTNLIWKEIATAPAGFCHPRSSMIGTLLEDIQAGGSFESVSRSFARKMHPLSYQRPQAAPTAMAIEQAERVVAQMGVASSFKRRFLRRDEVVSFWEAKPAVQEGGSGVFGSLRAKVNQSNTTLTPPNQVMTWEKFQRTVLPTAERIEAKVPHNGSFFALVTAEDPTAPPILQWDAEENRNPVSWYFWHGGSSASSFCLSGGSYADVECLTKKPPQWYSDGYQHHGEGVLLVIKGAKETKSAGLALFPEILRSEFHGIRSVIEAFSREGQISGLHEPHVAGLMFQKNDKSIGITLRVWQQGKSVTYTIDRWD
jgi:hypothetical protein